VAGDRRVKLLDKYGINGYNNYNKADTEFCSINVNWTFIEHPNEKNRTHH
jgi:hypothetical protein